MVPQHEACWGIPWDEWKKIPTWTVHFYGEFVGIYIMHGCSFVQMHPTKDHRGLHELFHGIWVLNILPDEEFGVKETCCHLETCSPHFSTTTPTHPATESAIPKLKKKNAIPSLPLAKRRSCSWNRNWWRWCWSHFRQKQEFPSVSRIHCWSDKTWNINKRYVRTWGDFFWGGLVTVRLRFMF